jgi:hypothetical protein
MQELVQRGEDDAAARERLCERSVDVSAFTPGLAA